MNDVYDDDDDDDDYGDRDHDDDDDPIDDDDGDDGDDGDDDEWMIVSIVLNNIFLNELFNLSLSVNLFLSYSICQALT